MNKIQNKKVIYKDLHQADYLKTWKLQEKLLQHIISIKLKNKKSVNDEISLTPNYFLFVSHPHIFTLGKNGNLDNLLISNFKLQDIKAQFIKTNRGGDITYHGPGQIVGYPIFDLDNFFNDIHKYMRMLEEVIIKTVNFYGIKGERSNGETGVWIDVNKPFARKICAIGVKASQWVTIHGFALNLSPNLSYFDYIVPCGIKNKYVTSLEKELGISVKTNEVKKIIKKYFSEIFDLEWI
ncbi:lipoyl(octanoyl) transferase [Apibacter mensalis]|uniref:Octanoyltransferase n=1 Tax=Apibacter mensalis TaxID=1586267 RepID=A0A0X3ASB1_9FLAO|nr:lipoyl(octanoyl) transferase LipB [Apibacter mensalis]CVK16965.1 lipoyl(octanoyl) transferase [Apibacter mensalis]